MKIVSTSNKPKKTGAAKPATKQSKAQTDFEKVSEYMDNLQHPLKQEIESVRKIIKASHPGISERIKWNAPSYYFREDMVTFHLRELKKVHLVFHHPAIVKINSPYLEGDYKDRRMMYFKDKSELKDRKKELERIMQELVKFQEP